VAGSHLGFAKKIFQGSRVTRTADKNKNSCQTILSKIKALLKLSSKSVGQGREAWRGLCGLRNSELGSLQRKKIAKEKLKNLIKQYH
jgi:hypothetical protein